MLSWLSCLPLLSVFVSVAGAAEVQLGETTLIGASFPDLQQEFFGGIPYAEPPVGSLRFAPPVLKLSPASPTPNASQFGPACMQANASGAESSVVSGNISSMSEDCLSINVFRPVGVNSSSLLPVMFWVHGGGFFIGAASVDNGNTIALQSIERGTPVILVNVDYRLAAFGYPQGEEAEARGATNLGNKDILAALTWVRENIGAFGGDKDKVTMFGVSAGSILTSQLLFNQSFDLARAAIFDSGFPASKRIIKASDREDAWQKFVSLVPERAGASSNNTSDCFRSASADTILSASATLTGTDSLSEGNPFCPVIDGRGGLIPDLPSRLFTSGRFSHIPFIAGTNLDEGTIFTPTTVNSADEIREGFINNTSPSLVTSEEQNSVIDVILDLYPDNPALGSPFGTGNETFGLNSQYKRAAAIQTDFPLASLRRQVAQVASRQRVKVFAYLFTDPQTTVPAYLGVYHGAEKPYIFGTQPNGPTSEELGRTMIDYWVSFATSLDPNDGRGNASRPVWTQYTPAYQDVMELNSAHTKMIPDTFRSEQIQFMNNHTEALLH